MWRAAESALAAIGVADVAGIGLTGQMHGLVLLDERMRPLRPAILWNDQRTAAECAEIERLVGLEHLSRTQHPSPRRALQKMSRTTIHRAPQ